MSANGAFSIRFWIISRAFKITFYQLSTVKQKILKSNPTGTPRRTDLDSTLILRPYAEDQIVVNFHVTFTCFFDIILLIEKFTSFPRTFFDVMSMVEKSKLLSRTFIDVISLVKKNSCVSTYFFRCNFDGRKIHVVLYDFFDETSTRKNSTPLLVKLQANENIRGRFPLLVTLKNWLSLNFSSKSPCL